MKHQRRIGQANVVVHCTDALRAEAEALLDRLAEIGERQPLRNGTIIQLGWAFVTLRGNNDELVARQPGFGTPDPEQTLVTGVDDVLEVSRNQRTVLSRLGIEGVTVRYDDTVTCWKGGLNERQIYLERLATEVPGSSGWRIDGSRMRMERTASDETETFPSYRLLSLRPSVLAVLPLPPGYIVLMRFSQIQAVFAPDNKNVWA